MSRDHYKGSKKDRDARIGHDGKLGPLSKFTKEQEEALFTERLRVGISDTPNKTILIVATASGDDANGDGTYEKPYRTFVRATKDVPAILNGENVVIDLTGLGTETVEEPVYFPAVSSSTGFTVSPIPVSYPFINSIPVYSHPVTLVAMPTIIQSLTPDSNSSQDSTGRKTITLSGAGWTPDEHKGRYLAKTDEPSSWLQSVIVGNTEDTITISSSYAVTGEWSIMELSAELFYGYSTLPALNYYSPALSMCGANNGLTAFGISFRSNTDGFPSLQVRSTDNLSFNMCTVEGWDIKAPLIQARACHFITEGLWMSGSIIYARGCFFDNVDIKAIGGVHVGHIWEDCTFDGCTPLANPPTSAAISGHAHDIYACTIVSGTGHGVVARGSYEVRVDKCLITDCVGDAIYAHQQGQVDVSRTSGSGNGGFGLRLDSMSQASVSTTALVTGDSGDFSVGVALADTWANFNAGFKNVFDTSAVSGTLSRMYNPSEY